VQQLVSIQSTLHKYMCTYVCPIALCARALFGVCRRSVLKAAGDCLPISRFVTLPHNGSCLACSLGIFSDPRSSV
jgi:hypothetical protein